MSKEIKYPKYIAPSGQTYKCIAYAVDIRTGWEWYGFEKVVENKDDVIYYGYVCGFADEFGEFSSRELTETGIDICTDASELNTIAPPIGWLNHA